MYILNLYKHTYLYDVSICTHTNTLLFNTGLSKIGSIPNSMENRLRRHHHHHHRTFPLNIARVLLHKCPK